MSTYGQKTKEAQALERYIRAVGDTPPEPEGKGAIGTLFDWLDTPGQAVRGGIAHLLDYQDYGNKSFFEAMGQGMDKDLDVGQMLDSTDFFKAGGTLEQYVGETPAWLLGAAAGFAGNVATDPLQWLTAGTTGLAKAGYRGLSKVPVLLETGEKAAIASRVAGLADKLKAASPKIGELDDLVAKGLMNSDEYGKHIAKIEKQAAIDSESPIRTIASILESQKKAKARGVSGEALNLLNEVDAVKKAEAYKQLGISQAVPMEDLLAKSAIRFRAPLGKTTYDIPGITKASEEIFDTMAGPLYTAKVRVGDTLDKVTKTLVGAERGDKITEAAKWVGGGLGGLLGAHLNLGLPGLVVAAGTGALLSEAVAPGIAKGAGKALTLAMKTPAQVSRTAAVGGDINADYALREHELSRHMLHEDAKAQLAAVTMGLPDEILADIPHIIEAGLRVNPKKLARGQTSEFSEQAFQQALNAKKALLNSQTPGMGDALEKATSRVRDDFASWAKEEQEQGVLSSAINYYVPHAYDLQPGIKAEAFENAAKDIAKRMDRFDMPRKYLTNDEAMIHGLVPRDNFKDLYAARLKAHEMALADKRALERLAYETALPKETYQKIVKMAFSENEEDALNAVRALKSRGMELNAEQIKSFTKMGILGEDTIFFPTRSTIRGALEKEAGELTEAELRTLNLESSLDDLARPTPLTGRMYENLFRMLNPSGPVSEEIITKAKRVADLIEAPGYGKLTFSPENYAAEKALVDSSAKNYEGKVAKLLGRFGENATDKSIAAELPPNLQNFINRVAKRGGISPEEKEFFTGVLPNPIKNVIAESWDTKNMLHRASDSLPPRLQKAVRSALDGYHGYLRVLKLGATVPFPGYHMRNMFSNALQGAQWFSVGEALSIPSLIKTAGLTRGEGHLVQQGTGRVFSGRQLNNLAAAHGLKTGFDATVDLIQSYADVFQSAAGVKEKPANVLAKTFDKGWTKLKDISQRIEEFGREHIFYKLIQDGHSPDSAAALTKELLVDYATGKTKFERDVLSNIFFFYSFARGQAANTLHSLVVNPGAITTQLNAMRGIGDLLKDPNALPLPPDWSEKVQTLRTSETGGQFLGWSKAGNPLVMGEVGLPIADLTRYVNIKAPKSLALPDLINAADQSVRRTMQSTFAQVNPILRAPMEYMFNKSLFFNRPLDDKTLRKLPKWENDLSRLVTLDYKLVPKEVFQQLDDDTQKVLRARDNGDGTMTVDPFSMMVLTNFIPGTGRALSTIRAASNTNKPLAQRIIQATTGTKVQEVDVEKSAAYNRVEQLKDFIKQRAYPTSQKDLENYLAYN